MPVAGHSLRAPALRSLHAGFASPSWLRLPPSPALGHGQSLAVGLRKPNRVSDWGMLAAAAPLGTAHARRRTLAAGSGPPRAASRLRFAILASLAAEPGSRARAAPRCRPQEAQSRERWGHAGSVAPLGVAHARRRTLAAGSGPPLAARRLRFAILASLAAEPGSLARAAPRCRPQEAQSRERWGHFMASVLASLGLSRGFFGLQRLCLARRKSSSDGERRGFW
jgi:hypothetical protein